MKQVWVGRALQVTGKYGEHAPMATVCCNACRTCFAANITALLGAAVAGAGLAGARFAKRVARR